MARGIEGNEISTPKPPTLKKSSSSSQSTGKGQKSILGFFSKKPASTPKSAFSDRIKTASAIDSTPAPSSDVVAPSSPVEDFHSGGKNKENGTASPSSLLEPVAAADGVVEGLDGVAMSSPSRKVYIHHF